ncbi:hypothetical protein J4E93_009775 [Alternaria ventricosa]|uniref:uncharacterized protein n=1 Tax=Alternaria ventricosa TaxID=1187951 RepID=UPI0020C4464B|nr:uncharacterized protein J4E93_009775 [Alternaria ventricosa]KAI4638747.1 hypothetical protein J4E93_009775 [Alternaria ventricosa]
MDSKESEQAKEIVASTPTSSSTNPSPDPDQPTFYDPKPSRKPPPQHGKTATGAPINPQTASALAQSRHKGSGVPASTLAALMAEPEPEPENKEKRSLRERWKEWKERKSYDKKDEELVWQVRGSSTQWNVFGSPVSEGKIEKGRSWK